VCGYATNKLGAPTQATVHAGVQRFSYLDDLEIEATNATDKFLLGRRKEPDRRCRPDVSEEIIDRPRPALVDVRTRLRPTPSRGSDRDHVFGDSNDDVIRNHQGLQL